MKGHTPPPHPDVLKQYNLNTEIGHGAFATVYKAFNRQNRRAYAIKVYPKSNLKTESDTALFQREIDAMAYVKHPGLVTLHDFITDENNFYLVMDFCAGGELFDYIIKNKKLDEPTGALIFKQIVTAISYLHSCGIAHRDLKPENILIDKFPRVMIADFGLCGFIQESNLMKTFCGSPTYSAPECILKQEYDGKCSDVWSLGVILFAMVTGEHPWKTENTSAMLHQIVEAQYTFPDYLSDDCKDLIGRMLVLNPSERLNCEQILSHPWLELEDKSKFRNTLAAKQLFTRELPDAPTVSVKTIAEEAKRGVSPKQKIISPFEEEEETSDKVAELPSLAIRSQSFMNLIQKHSDQFVKPIEKKNGKRKVLQSTGLSLAGFRQRSAQNLMPRIDETFGY